MSYRELVIWQKSKDLAVKIYKFTDYLPSKAKFSLAEQMNRAAISIPSNIAEGHGRSSTKDYIHSKGSLSELITQIEICLEVYPEYKDLINPLITLCEEINRMIHKLINRLKDNLRK